jgi:hypothetical protein
MSNRTQAVGMWILAALFVVAFFINLNLKASGETFRPLQLIVCIPLAIWSGFKGFLLWSRD